MVLAHRDVSLNRILKVKNEEIRKRNSHGEGVRIMGNNDQGKSTCISKTDEKHHFQV